MAEEAENSPAGDGTSAAAAIGIAMHHAPLDAGVAADLRAFLKKQTEVLGLQAEDLKREDRLHHWSLRVHHIGDILKLAFQFAAAALVVGIVGAAAAAVWSAAADNGLVIEAFSVPPDLAAQGLTGEVVAGKMLDRLSAMQAQTESMRAASSYANNWGNDIKVQIPDTGVSIGELDRDLRRWLGHETHISGAVYRTQAGIALAARAGSHATPVFTGSEAALDTLIEKAAEAVYRATQPYRYGVFVDQHNRHAEADATYRQLALGGSPLDRAWSYGVLANDIPFESGDFAKARQMAQRALAIQPGLLLAWTNIVQNAGFQQHDEEGLQALRSTIAIEAHGRDPTVNPSYFDSEVLASRAALADLQGDFHTAMGANDRILTQSEYGYYIENAYDLEIADCGRLHDAECLRNVLAAAPPILDASAPGRRALNLQAAQAAMGRWQDISRVEPWMKSRLSTGGPIGPIGAVILARFELPLTALAHAHLGDLATAHSEIDQTPADCVICLRVRGRIEAIVKKPGAAAFWFARAVEAAPSLPFGYADWGEALLRSGDYDGAIAKFREANLKGPRFADPLELWGEALMQKNRSDLALAKFEEAEKFAPNWGRLHLEWAKALLYAGRKDEAKKQLTTASMLELSRADKAALVQRGRHG